MISRIIICLLFSICIIIGIVDAQDDQQCLIPGECIDSVVLKHLYTSNEHACLHACRHMDPKCHFFTYAPDSQLCELLLNCVTVSDSVCPSCISGEVTCPICWVSGQCEGGQVVHITNANNNEECWQACQDFDSLMTSQNVKKALPCNWLTFNKEHGDCSLQYDCPTLDETCEDCVTAERICEGDNNSTTTTEQPVSTSSTETTVTDGTTTADETTPPITTTHTPPQGEKFEIDSISLPYTSTDFSMV